jgi:hypothetical protein
MHRTLIAAILFAFISLAAPAQTAQNPAQSAPDTPEPTPTPFEQAQTLAGKGRLDKALAILDQLAAQPPEPAGAER